MRTYGLAFYDPLCILVANSGKAKATFSIQMVNTYDCEWMLGRPGVTVSHHKSVQQLFVQRLWQLSQPQHDSVRHSPSLSAEGTGQGRPSLNICL